MLTHFLTHETTDYSHFEDSETSVTLLIGPGFLHDRPKICQNHQISGFSRKSVKIIENDHFWTRFLVKKDQRFWPRPKRKIRDPGKSPKNSKNRKLSKSRPKTVGQTAGWWWFCHFVSDQWLRVGVFDRNIGYFEYKNLQNRDFGVYWNSSKTTKPGLEGCFDRSNLEMPTIPE